MTLLANKKAHFEYEVLRTLMAGVVLTGAEVKSLRHKSGSLTGSFVKIIGEEAFLLNAQISPYKFANNQDYDPKRTRKLLLRHKEIASLLEASQQKGQSLIPLTFELLGNHIKVKVGVARGRKQFEKRAKLKERDIARDMAREMRDKISV